MTVKQRVILVLAVIALVAVIVFFVWYLQRPEDDTPDGVLVYREAYMRIADQPWQGGRLCHRE